MRHKSSVNLLNPHLPVPAALPAVEYRNMLGDVVTLTAPCPLCHAVAWVTPYPGYAVCGVCHPARSGVRDHRKGSVA